MASNKYAGKCYVCDQRVAARAGILTGRRGAWKVAHLSCDESGSAQVSVTHFPSTGETVYRNVRGRCEDAPCCGCCS